MHEGAGRRAERQPLRGRRLVKGGGRGGAWEMGAFGRGGHSQNMCMTLDTSQLPKSPLKDDAPSNIPVAMGVACGEG